MTNTELIDLLREARRYVGFCPTTQEGMDVIGAVRDRIDAAVESLASLAESMNAEYSLPKCEHGVEYGGMGVGCCLQCDNKALVSASNEPPKAQA